jgi:hypothetical protein
MSLNSTLDFSEHHNGGLHGEQYFAQLLRLMGVGASDESSKFLGYERREYQKAVFDRLGEFCSAAESPQPPPQTSPTLRPPNPTIRGDPQAVERRPARAAAAVGAPLRPPVASVWRSQPGRPRRLVESGGNAGADSGAGAAFVEPSPSAATVTAGTVVDDFARVPDEDDFYEKDDDDDDDDDFEDDDWRLAVAAAAVAGAADVAARVEWDDYEPEMGARVRCSADDLAVLQALEDEVGSSAMPRSQIGPGAYGHTLKCLHYQIFRLFGWSTHTPCFSLILRALRAWRHVRGYLHAALPAVAQWRRVRPHFPAAGLCCHTGAAPVFRGPSGIAPLPRLAARLAAQL